MTEIEFANSDAHLASLVRLGEGRQAEVYSWENGSAVKLMRDRAAHRDVVDEAEAMLAARASGAPMAMFLGAVEVEGRPGIVMQRLDGPDQLTLLTRQPWRLWSVGRSLGRLHAQLHSAPVGRALPSLKDAVRASIEESDLVPDDVRRSAIRALEGLPDGDYVCHGDFHPGNVIETKDGPKIIDWSNAVRGDRVADHARTTVLFGGGDKGVNPPLVMRLLDRVGRRVVWRAYLNTYRRLRPYDDAELRAWLPVAAAHRLTENIPGERDYLLRLARSGQRFIIPPP